MIVDYSKLDIETIDFLIEELEKMKPKRQGSMVKYGVDRAINLLKLYQLKAKRS